MDRELREDFLVFGQPFIGQEEINEVIDSLHNAWLGTGPKVQTFEKNFSIYKNTPNVAALYSCTAGLHLACKALGLRTGDEVITTAMTFAATVNAIINSGAKPILVDIDPFTLNIDTTKIEQAITARTKAIIPVHFAGRPCNMAKIMDLAKAYKLFVIEDCAHAIESEFMGEKTGTFGDVGVFSFYATKNIATGEGGMVISRNEDIIQRIKILALHGLSRDAWKRFSDEGYKHYYVEEPGFKYNMMDLQAAIGIHQLKKIEIFSKRRKEIWDIYNKSFEYLPIRIPHIVEENTRHAYHLYTIRINKEGCGITRDKFLEEINKYKIGVGVHYLSIPEHPFYQREFKWDPDDYPEARDYGRETVSLPLSPKLTEQDVDDVIEAVTTILSIKC